MYRVSIEFSESLGELEMLWEHEPQASVSTAFSSFPKLPRVFLSLDRNTGNMFSVSCKEHRDGKKKNNLLTVIIKIKLIFACFSIELWKHDF